MSAGSLFRLGLAAALALNSLGSAAAAGSPAGSEGVPETRARASVADGLMAAHASALMMNPAAPESLLRAYARTDGSWRALAYNPSTPADILDSYVPAMGAPRPDEDLIYAVSCNPSASAATLERIWSIGIDAGRYPSPTDCLLSNPSTPAWILEEAFPEGGYAWVKGAESRIVDLGGGVRASEPSDAFLEAGAIAKNPNAPAELLRKTNLSAINPNAPADLLEKLADDPNEEVRIWVAGNVSTPAATLAKLARDESWWVRAQVAGNPKAPVRTLYELSREPDDKILRGTGHRHWNSELRYGLAGNPRTPRFVLEKLMEDPENLSALARNPALADESYEDLYRTSVDSEPVKLGRYDPERLGYIFARIGLAENPGASVELLDRLAQDEQADVRSAAARNPNVPAATLAKLARDEDDSVVSAVAGNPAVFRTVDR